MGPGEDVGWRDDWDNWNEPFLGCEDVELEGADWCRWEDLLGDDDAFKEFAFSDLRREYWA